MASRIVVSLLLLALPASSAVADSSPDTAIDSVEVVVPEAQRPVSTSPIVSKGAPADSAHGRAARAALDETLPPLTRAAEKLRIDEMTPLRWLAHFGPVSIGRLE